MEPPEEPRVGQSSSQEQRRAETHDSTETSVHGTTTEADARHLLPLLYRRIIQLDKWDIFYGAGHSTASNITIELPGWLGLAGISIYTSHRLSVFVLPVLHVVTIVLSSSCFVSLRE